MSTTQLILLYLIGWIPMIYVGMMINNRAWKRYHKDALTRTYRRGWNAGFGYLQRISDIRTERDSYIRVLTEED